MNYLARAQDSLIIQADTARQELNQPNKNGDSPAPLAYPPKSGKISRFKHPSAFAEKHNWQDSLRLPDLEQKV
ncbi:MAG: hypothetical protein HC880_18865, partial [Bacteroidia bacterium]|nr:hypothetical protein [Bacteroidia bacterium]